MFIVHLLNKAGWEMSAITESYPVKGVALSLEIQSPRVSSKSVVLHGFEVQVKAQPRTVDRGDSDQTCTVKCNVTFPKRVQVHLFITVIEQNLNHTRYRFLKIG